MASLTRLTETDASTLDVLYIHPAVGRQDFHLPMGLISLMNSLACRKLGVMLWELTPSLIRRARIAVLDLNWYFPLALVERTAALLKQYNPRIVVVVGGATATIFARQIVDRFAVDYVIRGDAERPFRRLIQNLLDGGLASDGGSRSKTPNVVFPGGATPWSYTVSPSDPDYTQLDPVTVDWFPTFRRRMLRVHREHPGEFREDLGVYPFVPVLRGCRAHCDGCYANPRNHWALFRRGFVARPADAVIDSLERCQHAGLTTAHLIGDFCELLPESFADAVLGRDYGLHLTYDLFNLPPLERIQQFLARFRSVRFICHLFRDHGDTPCPEHAERLWQLLTQLRDTTATVALFADFRQVDRVVLQDKLAAWPHVGLFDNAYWYLPVPYPGDEQQVREQFEHFYRLCRGAM